MLIPLITVLPVNQEENNLLQNVHVHPDKLILTDLVSPVSTDVPNVAKLPQTVLFVLLIELMNGNVTVMKDTMMMDIPPNVNHVKTLVLPVLMETVVLPVLPTELKIHHHVHVKLDSSIATTMVLVVNVLINVLNVLDKLKIVLFVKLEELTIHQLVAVHMELLKLTKFVYHVMNTDVKLVLKIQ